MDLSNAQSLIQCVNISAISFEFAQLCCPYASDSNNMDILKSWKYYETDGDNDGDNDGNNYGDTNGDNGRAWDPLLTLSKMEKITAWNSVAELCSWKALQTILSSPLSASSPQTSLVS